MKKIIVQWSYRRWGYRWLYVQIRVNVMATAFLLRFFLKLSWKWYDWISPRQIKLLVHLASVYIHGNNLLTTANKCTHLWTNLKNWFGRNNNFLVYFLFVHPTSKWKISIFIMISRHYSVSTAGYHQANSSKLLGKEQNMYIIPQYID